MGKSIFQPDHAGRPTPQKLDDVHHVHDRTHEWEASREDGNTNIARVGGKPKGGVVQLHGGMVKQSAIGPALGGDHASAMDALSGLKVVPGKPGAAATAHPLIAPPVAKNYGAVPVNPGTKDAPSAHAHDPELGKAIWAEATGNNPLWKA